MEPITQPLPPELLATREGYDRWSEIYDTEQNPLVVIEQPHVDALLGDVRALELADIGCGTGRHALRLAAAGARVTALDFSRQMLNKAMVKPGAQAVRFIQHDLAEPLPLQSGRFDIVLCGLVLDHIEALPGLLSEMRRICKPAGRIVISVMHPAMNLKGVQARFTDPATGRETRLASCSHTISDYVMAASGAGLTIDHISEHRVDEALAARYPRAAKYLGWPLLLVMRLVMPLRS